MLSKRIFFAGCFGLPWLWTVHCLFHWNSTQGCCSSSSSKSGDATADPQISSDNDDGDQQDNNDTNDETLLNPDDREYIFYLHTYMHLQIPFLSEPFESDHFYFSHLYMYKFSLLCLTD